MAMNDTHTPAADHGFTQDELPGYPDKMTRPNGSRQGDGWTAEALKELERTPHDERLSARLAANGIRPAMEADILRAHCQTLADITEALAKMSRQMLILAEAKEGGPRNA